MAAARREPIDLRNGQWLMTAPGMFAAAIALAGVVSVYVQDRARIDQVSANVDQLATTLQAFAEAQEARADQLTKAIEQRTAGRWTAENSLTWCIAQFGVDGCKHPGAKDYR